MWTTEINDSQICWQGTSSAKCPSTKTKLHIQYAARRRSSPFNTPGDFPRVAVPSLRHMRAKKSQKAPSDTKVISMPSPFSEQVPDAGEPIDPAELDSLMQEVEKEFSVMSVKARNAIRKRSLEIHPELQPLGYRVLSMLVRQQAQQQIVLAAELQVDKATMSRTIKQLQDQGLVTREPDPSDGRAMLVSITDSAHEAWLVSGRKARSLLRERLSSWSPEEISRFADLLSRLNANETAD